MKNFVLEFIKFLLFLVVFYLILIVIIKYMDYKQDIFEKEQEEKMYITDLYRVVWKFHFGKRSLWWFWWDTISYHAICDETKKNCYEIKWVIIKWESIYIYDGSWFLNDSSEKIFWIFTQESEFFYSLNELETLPEEQKDILLDLKENPRFIFE